MSDLLFYSLIVICLALVFLPAIMVVVRALLEPISSTEFEALQRDLEELEKVNDLLEKGNNTLAQMAKAEAGSDEWFELCARLARTESELSANYSDLEKAKKSQVRSDFYGALSRREFHVSAYQSMMRDVIEFATSIGDEALASQAEDMLAQRRDY
jgi:cell division protein FtsB